MFKKLKDKKGFTLVELIVVLVILAILAALLVPALTGYIDKANQEKAIAECRSVVVAAQTTSSEYYGLNKDFADTTNGKSYTKNALEQIKTLSEATDKWVYKITIDTTGTAVPKGTVTRRLSSGTAMPMLPTPRTAMKRVPTAKSLRRMRLALALRLMLIAL